MTNMVNWLLPKEKKFFLMLRRQASNVVEGADVFKEFIGKYNSLSDVKKKEFVSKIKEIECKGDNITHEIIGSLDKTFVTPIDKEDIHRLAGLLDDVLDLINATAIRLVIFRISKIDSHMIKMTDVVKDIVKTIELGVISVSKLRPLNRFYIDVHTLENKGDDMYHEALDKLFTKKDPLNIMKYKEIYEFLEDIMDKCEDIANVIESIVVKHA
jgi:uncharacterized protein